MLKSILIWMGFLPDPGYSSAKGAGRDSHRQGHGHGHKHGDAHKHDHGHSHGGQSHEHGHEHGHGHDHGHEKHGADDPHSGHGHDHGHDHRHDHEHGHDEEHGHDGGHEHDKEHGHAKEQGHADNPGGKGSGHGHSHFLGLGHDHGAGEHGHTHGVIDPTIATTARGIWAIKWAFVILMATTVMQVVVFLMSGSIALLADTVHNFGDAATAIPLWIAFLFARRAASRRFNYGLNRVEDIAGVTIVGIILFSAVYAGYASVERLINPQPLAYLGYVAAAGIIGFLGNEAVAVFRIRVGRQINSAALIADGYHARVDGFTSLAVVLGAAGVAAGFPLADPIIGLVITLMIFGIVWQSARAVFTRMLDGIEPEVLDEIEHTASHVPGIVKVRTAKARWLGHTLRAEVELEVDPALKVGEAEGLIQAYERELRAHLPALHAVHTSARPAGA